MRENLDELVADFTRSAGRPVVNLAEAAGLLGVSVATLRQAVYRGALRVSRAAPNAPCYVTTRELARYHVDGLRRSLPETAGAIREERARRLAVARERLRR
ncbi:MAG: hypothetical protein HY720_02295 [Planctomycetes bacterium]|nr:hypothetical protein [Planctomycetota bacterium]